MLKLQAAISGIHSLPPHLMDLYLASWDRWSVSKDHFLLREHAIADHIFFVDSGMCRIFYKKNGKEVTEWIAPDGTFLFSITSFFQRVPGKLIIHTIEPSVIYGIHHHQLHQLAAMHHEIETLYRKMLATSLILSQTRMESIQFESAEQRYKKLIQLNPGFLQRVPLTYLASFLGITLETLSRIRSTFASGN